MLTIRLVRGSPDFFNTEDVRKFYSFFSSIITIMDTIYARWAAHVTVFFTIVIAGVSCSNLKKVLVSFLKSEAPEVYSKFQL